MIKSKLRETKGASMVEFALVLPILILILFGIIEFGILIYNQQVITNASREGARYGIVS
jgi:Flp pilus assembly protein TadG